MLALLLLAAGALWWHRRTALDASGVPAPASFVDWSSIGADVGTTLEQLIAPVTAAVAHFADAGSSIMSTGTGSSWAPKAAATPYLELVMAAELKYNLPHNLLARLIEKESAWNPSAVNPSSGAQGLAQFMPATAAEFRVDPFDPASAIDGAARYLTWLHARLGDWRQVLAAYNWGIGNVQRRGMAAMPAETRDYVATIAGDVGLA